MMLELVLNRTLKSSWCWSLPRVVLMFSTKDWKLLFCWTIFLQ